MNQQLAPRLGPGSRPPAVALVIAQLLAGGALGAAGGYFGMELGWRLLAGEPFGLGDIVTRIYGLLAGFAIGCAAGVALAGRLMGGRGALWAALLGAVLGGGATMLTFALLFPSALVVGWALTLLAGLAGAVVGYGLSARGR